MYYSDVLLYTVSITISSIEQWYPGKWLMGGSMTTTQRLCLVKCFHKCCVVVMSLVKCFQKCCLVVIDTPLVKCTLVNLPGAHYCNNSLFYKKIQTLNAFICIMYTIKSYSRYACLSFCMYVSLLPLVLAVKVYLLISFYTSTLIWTHLCFVLVAFDCNK